MLGFFSWKRISNEKFEPQLAIIWAFFLKLGRFFPIYQKGQGRPPPLPPLVTRLKKQHVQLL